MIDFKGVSIPLISLEFPLEGLPEHFSTALLGCQAISACAELLLSACARAPPRALHVLTPRGQRMCLPQRASVRASVRASIRSVRGGNGRPLLSGYPWHFRSRAPASEVHPVRHLGLTNAGICAIISCGRSFGKRCGIWSGNRRGGLVPYITGIPPVPMFMSSLSEILFHFTPIMRNIVSL